MHPSFINASNVVIVAGTIQGPYTMISVGLGRRTQFDPEKPESSTNDNYSGYLAGSKSFRINFI